MQDTPPTAEQLEIFGAIKELMKPYEKYFSPHHNEEKYYDLWYDNPVTVNGREYKEFYFAGLIIQKNYVGFYFMPVYTTPDKAKIFKPELLQLLKGKSCFHIKKNDPQIMEQIKDALGNGIEVYKQRFGIKPKT